MKNMTLELKTQSRRSAVTLLKAAPWSERKVSPRSQRKEELVSATSKELTFRENRARGPIA